MTRGSPPARPLARAGTFEVVVLRDGKESPRKCSLTPLRGRPEIRFLEWRPSVVLDAAGHTLLHVGGEPLTAADRGRPLLLLDASWKKVPRMLRSLRGDPARRSIPRGWETAYPRRSKTFPDPPRGLASVEALFAASAILGEPRFDLLEGYAFAEAFLRANARRLGAPVAPAEGSLQ